MKEQLARELVLSLIDHGVVPRSKFGFAYRIALIQIEKAQLEAKPEDWHTTGQPVPYKPADGQF